MNAYIFLLLTAAAMPPPAHAPKRTPQQQRMVDPHLRSPLPHLNPLPHATQPKKAAPLPGTWWPGRPACHGARGGTGTDGHSCAPFATTKPKK